MKNLVKTTVTIPEDILQAAKFTAFNEKTTLSSLIREALKKRIYGGKSSSIKKNPIKLLGKFKLGATKIYNKRSDLYEEHLRRKMGF